MVATPNYRTGRAVVLALVAFAAALAVVAVLGRPTIRLRPQSPPRKPTLVVLPFENLSGDADLELISTRIADAVSDSVSATGRFAVTSRGAVLGRAVAKEGLEEEARRLRADYVIAGSIERKGRLVALDAYFFRAGPEPGLWVERLEWKDSEKASLVRDFAARIGEAFARGEKASQSRPR
jgi:adenylate cyclase